MNQRFDERTPSRNRDEHALGGASGERGHPARRHRERAMQQTVAAFGHEQHLVEHDPRRISAPRSEPEAKRDVRALASECVRHILHEQPPRRGETGERAAQMPQGSEAEHIRQPMNRDIRIRALGRPTIGAVARRRPDLDAIASLRQSARELIRVVAHASALRRIFTADDMPRRHD